MSSEKQPTISEETKVRTTIRTLVAIAALIAAFVTAWTWVLSDVRAQGNSLQQHQTRLDTLEQRLSSDHDILIEIRQDVKALMADKRGAK